MVVGARVFLCVVVAVVVVVVVKVVVVVVVVVGAGFTREPTIAEIMFQNTAIF